MFTERQIALLKIVTGFNVTVPRAVVRESADLAKERHLFISDGPGRGPTIGEQRDEVSDALLALEKHLETVRSPNLSRPGQQTLRGDFVRVSPAFPLTEAEIGVFIGIASDGARFVFYPEQALVSFAEACFQFDQRERALAEQRKS